MAGNNYGWFILFIGAVIAFCIVCYIVAKCIPKWKVLKLIGRNTIVYLSLQGQIIKTFMYYEGLQPLIEEHPYIIAIMIFIGLIPIAYIVERWVPILLGKKKRKYS